jgi:hypothetical protein
VIPPSLIALNAYSAEIDEYVSKGNGIDSRDEKSILSCYMKNEIMCLLRWRRTDLVEASFRRENGNVAIVASRGAATHFGRMVD